MTSEDKQKLLNDETRNESSTRVKVIMLGASNLMKNWPDKNDIVTALLGGCITSTILVIFILLPILSYNDSSNTCRFTRFVFY